MRQYLPKTWLLESILVTILCFFPFGIIGIVNALKVENLYRAGAHSDAREASAKAKQWVQLSLFTGLLLYFSLLVYCIVF